MIDVKVILDLTKELIQELRENQVAMKKLEESVDLNTTIVGEFAKQLAIMEVTTPQRPIQHPPRKSK